MADNQFSIRSLLMRNKRLKGLSLLLGLVSWYVIQDTISSEKEITEVRLQIKVPEGMAIFNQSVPTVDVTVRGSQDDLQMLDRRQIEAVVELSEETGPLPHEVIVTPGMIQGLRGARAVAVHPARVQVTLDRQSEKQVPVRGRIVGTPLSGQVESVECQPATVRLRGPAAKLETTGVVYTQPVDVDGRVESFVRRSAIQAPGDNWVARIDPADVQVKVTISGKTPGQERN